MRTALITFDLQVLRHVFALRSAFLTNVFVVVTAFGTVQVAFLLSFTIAGLTALRNDRRNFGRLALATFGGWGWTEILKLWIARPRPSIIVPLVAASGYSFPSGHSIISSATYFALAILISRQLRKPLQRVFVFAAAACVVMAVAFSRVYLAVHYPSDTVAGILFGLIWALVATRIKARSAES